jgi:hypothetical protein
MRYEAGLVRSFDTITPSLVREKGPGVDYLPGPFIMAAG